MHRDRYIYLVSPAVVSCAQPAYLITTHVIDAVKLGDFFSGMVKNDINGNVEVRNNN